jgi:hypothetical protein
VTCEHGGGFLAAGVLGAGAIDLAGVSGFEEADPEIGLHPFAGGSLASSSRCLLTTVATGGAASWLVLGEA